MSIKSEVQALKVIQPVIDLHNVRLEQAAEKLKALTTTEELAVKNLDKLFAQRCSYDSDQIETYSALQLKNRAEFLATLDKNIVSAKLEVVRCREEIAAGKYAWMEERKQMLALDTIIERHNHRIAELHHKAAQKDSDEWSSNNVQRRSRE